MVIYSFDYLIQMYFSLFKSAVNHFQMFVNDLLTAQKKFFFQ